MTEGNVIEVHITDVEATVFDPRCEKKGEAPSFCIIGWTSQLEFLAFLSHQAGTPPAVILVHNFHIIMLVDVWGSPVQQDVVPPDSRTSQMERCLSLCGGGDLRACREGEKKENKTE